MTNVLLEKKGHIAVATINRPKALNALNSQVLEDIDQLVEQVKADDEIRALVITGSGEKAFVAGADIGEMSTLTKAEGEAFGKKGNDVFRKLETLPVPTIAAVNGFALGGGCELSMSCDIRLCADTAVFGQPEAGLGITPGFGGTQRLARLVGMGMAKQLIYTAKNIKADEALRIGLVNAVYPLEELMPAADADLVIECVAENMATKKELLGRLDAMEKANKEEASQWQRIERELGQLKADMPLNYVRREDYIRGQSVIEAKLDALASKLETAQLRVASIGGNHAH